MPLYREFETETSYRYLERIAKALHEPVCLLGGWAVYLTVNDRFREEQGSNYLGSRDIDVGFRVDEKLDEKQLGESSVATSLSLLEQDGFRLLGFRLYKEVRYETGEELAPEAAQNTPTYDIFTLYVDPVVDVVHPLFRKVFGFTPVDEPLLAMVFDDERYRSEVRIFNKMFWIPTPDVLLATKVKSIPNRTRDEKLVKDICDAYALCWYAGVAFQHIKRALHDILTPATIKRLQQNIAAETEVFQQAERAVGIAAETIETALMNLTVEENVDPQQS
jgi:hypothetical protein